MGAGSAHASCAGCDDRTAPSGLVCVRLVRPDGLDLLVSWGVLLVPGLGPGTIHLSFSKLKLN